ncbi:UNVERIFIED_CONTAM: hypothetical protein FKN15_044826 [Acipenser sinensis]
MKLDLIRAWSVTAVPWFRLPFLTLPCVFFLFLCLSLAGAYYPAQGVQQYPPAVPSPTVMMNPAQQIPPKRERKQIRIRDPNQGGRDITEEIMSGGRTTSTPTPPQPAAATVKLTREPDKTETTFAAAVVPPAGETETDTKPAPSEKAPEPQGEAPAHTTATSLPAAVLHDTVDSQTALTPPLTNAAPQEQAAEEAVAAPALPPAAVEQPSAVETPLPVAAEMRTEEPAPEREEEEQEVEEEEEVVVPLVEQKVVVQLVEQEVVVPLVEQDVVLAVVSVPVEAVLPAKELPTETNGVTPEPAPEPAPIQESLPPTQPQPPPAQASCEASLESPIAQPEELNLPNGLAGLGKQDPEPSEEQPKSDVNPIAEPEEAKVQEAPVSVPAPCPAPEPTAATKLAEEEEEEEAIPIQSEPQPASAAQGGENAMQAAAVSIQKKKRKMKDLNKKETVGDLLDAFKEVSEPEQAQPAAPISAEPEAARPPAPEETDETWEEKEDKLDTENIEPDQLKPGDLKYKYKEEQWKPINPEEKKQYDREFLLGFQFIVASMQKPEGLPHISDVVLDKANKNPLRALDPSRLTSMNAGPDFTPSYANLGRQPMGGRGPPSGMGPRRSQQGQRKEPRKIIATVSLGEDVQLNKAEKAWKPGAKRPPSKEEEDASSDNSKTQELFRRVRGILNKLTPQMFQQLMKQVTELTIDTEERLKGVIDLIFEKAISEPNFSVAYANMCRCLMGLKVSTTDKPGVTVNFRKLLLNRCQKEFEKDKDDDEVFEKKQKELDAAAVDDEKQRLREELEVAKDTARRRSLGNIKFIGELFISAALSPPFQDDEKQRLREELEVAKDTARRRSLGNIKFIGELFKLKMLTEPIMHDCIVKLLKNHDEESLECLCRLLSTIGKDLDFEKAKPRMDQYFNQMEKIIKEKKTSSRIRFMLQDVIDLRRNTWVPRRGDQGPKTIDQIHKEAELEEHREQIKVQQQLLSKKDNRRGGGGAGRPSQTQDEGWNTVPISTKNRPIDTSRLSKITKCSVFASAGVCGVLQCTEQYYKGLLEILEIAEDMEIDIPHIWLYLAELITPMLHEGGIPMEELFKEVSKPLVPLGKAGLLLVEILSILCKGMSHKKAGALWREAGLSWKDFLPEDEDVNKFVTEKKVEFTLGDDSEKTSKKELSSEELCRQLDKLLKEKADNQRIYDWVEANLDEQQVASNTVIRAVMTSICQSAIIFENPCRLDTKLIVSRSKVLQKYLIDEEKELQALYALQALLVKLEQPPNLLRMFFDALYDEDVIKEEAFYKWELSKDPAELQGKGVALKSVTAFFTWLREAEDESDSLFEPGDMQYELSRNSSTDPSITDMVDKAIRVLRRNPQGFFLLVEGGKIDVGHHYGKARLALYETMLMDEAVARARELTNDRETLTVVSADHSHTLTLGGYTDRGNPIFGNANLKSKDITYSVDFQIPDSSSTATAMLCGVKTNLNTVGISAAGRNGICSSQQGNEVTSILRWSKEAGKSVGIVTTTRVQHATPATAYAHSASRKWYSDSDMPLSAKKAGCRDIAYQLIFNTDIDYDIGCLSSLDVSCTCSWRVHALPTGGKIDQGHHASRAAMALHETVMLDETVERALELTTEEDTLTIVTADHSHSFTFNGFPFRGNPILGKSPVYGKDFLPYTTLLYGNGPGHKIVNNARPDIRKVDTASKDYVQQSSVLLDKETHGGEDVAVFARGPMAHLFHGVQEQNYVAHAMAYAACVGENQGHCTKPSASANDSPGNAGAEHSASRSAQLAGFILIACLLH